MGLDITAYQGLSPAPHAEVDADGNPVEFDKFACFSPTIIEWTDTQFPGRTEGVKPGVYTFAAEHGFRAGSYSGYNAWRDWLARIAGWSSATACWESGKSAGPFLELINFADNEGVIGPKVAAKLAKDFAEHETKAEQMADGETYYLEKYREWKKATEMASDNGAIDFH